MNIVQYKEEIVKVKRNTLLLLACLVWCIAGINVLRIGINTYSPYISIANFVLSAVVFTLFHVFVFNKLVNKHTTRILSYVQDKVFFLNFFDQKSFLIMAIMIFGGIGLRESGIVSLCFVAVFYTGLGASLLEAGILFGFNYYKSNSYNQCA